MYIKIKDDVFILTYIKLMKLHRLVTEFGRACDQRNLRVNVGKSKVNEIYKREPEWKNRSGIILSTADVTRRDRIRNKLLFRRASVKIEIAYRVYRNVLRWSSHVEGTDANCLMNKKMNAYLDGKTLRGRPRFNWMDNVKNASSNRELSM